MPVADRKQIYIDVGSSVKTLIRSMTIAMGISFAIQQYINEFQHNTHFKAIYATCLFASPWENKAFIASHPTWRDGANI
jgi:hypothetical protein